MESLFMKKIEIGGNIRPILVAGVAVAGCAGDDQECGTGFPLLGR